MGLDAETGVFMLLVLDLSQDEYKKNGQLNARADLEEAIIHGAVKRARPKAMTVFAAADSQSPKFLRGQLAEFGEGGLPNSNVESACDQFRNRRTFLYTMPNPSEEAVE